MNCHPSLAGGIAVSLCAGCDQQEKPRLSIILCFKQYLKNLNLVLGKDLGHCVV